MNKKCIFFRVDSSDILGFGHLNRCLILAKTLQKKGFEIHFICKNLKGNLISKIKICGFTIHKIKNSKNTIEYDYQNTKKILKKFSWDISCIIIDNYHWGKKYEEGLRPLTKNIFVIDDLADRKHDCDILLDQNLYVNFKKRYKGLVPNKCIKLLGPKYVLLRKEFLVRKKRKHTSKIKKIFISFGGQDYSDQSIKVLKAIKKSKLKYDKINLVIGKSNKFLNKLKLISKEIDNIEIFSGTNNISGLMENSDLGIGASGSMMWERAYLGIPSLVSIIAKNQKLAAESMEKIGCVKNLGLAKNVSVKDYVKYFINMKISDLNKMSERNYKLIDGKGAERISQKMIMIIKEQENKENLVSREEKC